MIIRPARPSDAARVTDIQNIYIRDTAVTFNSREKSVEETAASIQSLPFFAVAEDEEQVWGFICYDQLRKGYGYARAMEHSILMDRSATGRGVGRRLVEAAEKHAREAGIGSLWAGVSGENPGGVSFHARIGFEEVARLPKVGFKFGRWMDLILMRKWLQEGE